VLRERGYEKPIVALTAHHHGAEVERARREGCNEVLTKPVTPARLREVLEPLLAGRSTSSPPAPQLTDADLTISDGPISVRIDPLLAELVPKFMQRCQQTVVEFQDAVRSGDITGARRIGHALHGTAGSFGFDEMAGIGKEIEQAALGGDSVTLKKLAERLDTYVARVRPVFD